MEKIEDIKKGDKMKQDTEKKILAKWDRILNVYRNNKRKGGYEKNLTDNGVPLSQETIKSSIIGAFRAVAYEVLSQEDIIPSVEKIDKLWEKRNKEKIDTIVQSYPEL